ncbi:MAG: hypothetical protein OJF50_004872 [Nitrospira sp.]|nr:hypothetical protein [Nitrospira sp.]
MEHGVKQIVQAAAGIGLLGWHGARRTLYQQLQYQHRRTLWLEFPFDRAARLAKPISPTLLSARVSFLTARVPPPHPSPLPSEGRGNS